MYIDLYFTWHLTHASVYSGGYGRSFILFWFTENVWILRLNVFDEAVDLRHQTTDYKTNHEAEAFIRRLNMGHHVV